MASYSQFRLHVVPPTQFVLAACGKSEKVAQTIVVVTDFSRTCPWEIYADLHPCFLLCRRMCESSQKRKFYHLVFRWPIKRAFFVRYQVN